MTTAQLDHLRAIDAHLSNLLEQAKKRTPGEWSIYDNGGLYPCPGIEAGGNSIVVIGDNNDDAGVRTGFDDAAFIASCAGNAEAGWIATKAAIAHILWGGQGHDNGEDLLAASILAAFPLELLGS